MKPFIFWSLPLSLWIALSTLPAWATALAEIQQRGHLVVGVKDNLPPLGYRDTTGAFQGFEIDLAKRFAKALFQSEQAIVFKPLRNVQRLTAVASGEVDMAIAGITLTENRQRVVNFSEPYYRSGTGLLSTNPQWSSLQGLYRQTIAVLAPSVTLAYLKPRLPKATLVGVESYREAQSRLDNAQVQAIAGDQVVLSHLAQQNARYFFYPTALTVQPLAIALPKGVQHDSLQQWVNRHLRDWKAEGWLENQRQRWRLP